MLKNRLLYGMVILVFLTFVHLNESPLTYGVLYALFILPIFSFLLARRARNHFYISATLSTPLISKKEKADFTVVVENHHFLPYPIACLRLDGNHTGLGVDKKDLYFPLPARGTQITTFHLEGVFRGEYELGVNYLAVYDFLGLFKFKYPHPKRSFLMVTPDVFPIPTLPLDPLEVELETRTSYLHYETSNTVSELRPYQRADSQRQIHWKATAKRGELISKEFQPITKRGVDFFVHNTKISGSPELALKKEDRLMGYVASALEQCSRSRYPITLHYLDSSNALPPQPATDFATLYREVSRIRFDYKDDFSKLLNNHAQRGQPASNVMVFTHHLDDQLLSGLQRLKMSGNHLIVCTFEGMSDHFLKALEGLDVQLIYF